SAYNAYEGVNTGGLNGVYWIRVLERRKDGTLLIENLHDIGKIKVKPTQTVIEPDLVYPLLRGRDVSRWLAEPSAHLILAQDPDLGKGIPETEMKKRYPKTYSYLKQFEGDKTSPKRGSLRGRALFKLYCKPTDPFYSMYNVNSSTLAPWKVYWTRVATEMGAASAGGNKSPILCVETATFVPFEGPEEAYYFAACLNSSPCRAVIESYSSKSTGSFGSPHVLTNVSIPKFQQIDRRHSRLVELSRNCHHVRKNDDWVQISALELEIDEIVANMFVISHKELVAIQEAIK
ncbi:MAG: hypothetical protein MN733_37265, partial [Nitrososphaera sp.]|nr:hypothetical protein [Nitrososphaera sp.]